MAAVTQNITAEQGSALSVTFTGAANGSLQNRSLRMHVRDKYASTATKLTASTDAGTLAVGADPYTTATLTLNSAVMGAVSVTKPTEYWVYDVESYTTANDVRREWQGTFTITRDVTRDTESTEEDRLAGVVRYDTTQSLTSAQQLQARTNIGAGTGAGSAAWGGITGTLSDQTDLQSALDAKQASSATLTTLSSATAAGLALMDDATAADQRTTLGLGTAAVAATGDFEAAGAVSAHVAAPDPHAQYALESSLGGAALLNVGTTTGTVAAGDDSRLSDARTPTAHAASHATAGSDPIAPADIGAAAASHTHAASDITSGTIATARLGSGTADGTTFLRGDQTWATPAGGSPGGSSGQVQYNDGGSFGGMSGILWDSVNSRASFGAGASPSGKVHVQAGAASEIAGVFQAATSQTANILECRNGAGSLIAAVTSTGNLRIASAFINGSGGTLTIADTNGGTSSGDLTCATFRGARYRDDTNSVALASLDGVIGVRLGSARVVAWSSNTTWFGTADLQVTRAGANILGILDGSTGGGAVELKEMTAPSAPPANCVRIYAEDNGSGKTRLMALFPSGAAQQIAIEP